MFESTKISRDSFKKDEGLIPIQIKIPLSVLIPGKTYVDSSSGIRFLFIEKHKQGTPKYIGDNSSEEKERYGLYYNPVTGCQQEIELFEYPIYVEVE